ncbi:MAG: hypothetical protein K2X47_20030, partial [Bdellovibrionales bacterium]|nr:hypothetical protein [Bdellovibrionales bacterium]
VFVSGYVRNERGSTVLIRSTTDRGRNWRTVANPMSTADSLSVHAFTQDPGGRMYLIATTGTTTQNAANLLVSDDNGRTWTMFYGWVESAGFLDSRIAILTRGEEIVLVGSTKVGPSAGNVGWVRRTTALGAPWKTYQAAGEYDLGGRFTGIHQFGTSPLLISGTDRMPNGEDRVTYRSFKPTP